MQVIVRNSENKMVIESIELGHCPMEGFMDFVSKWGLDKQVMKIIQAHNQKNDSVLTYYCTPNLKSEV